MSESTVTGQPPRKLLDESTLKGISRNIRRYIPTHEDDSGKVIELSALLHESISTAGQPNLPVTHTVAAVNTICAIVDQVVVSALAHNVQILLNRTGSDFRSTTLWKCVELYFVRGGRIRPKSAKQLLSTLTGAIRRIADWESIHHSIALIGQRIHDALIAGEDSGALRPCLQMFTSLLRKNLISLQDVISKDSILYSPDSKGKESQLQSRADLLVLLMRCGTKNDLVSTVGQTLSAMLDLPDGSDRMQYASTESHPPIWAQPLKQAFIISPDSLDKLQTRIFPVLFRSSADYLVFIKSIGFDQLVLGNYESDEHRLLFAALTSGKELGLITLTDETGSLNTGPMVLKYRQINQLLASPSAQARTCGLSLLILSHSVTKPFGRRSLSLLRKHLHHIHADTDADFRGELFALTNKLFDRLRGAMANLARHNAKDFTHGHSRATSSERALATSHKKFIIWYLRFLMLDLRPSASYQRHICALRCLEIAVKSGLDDRVAQSSLSKTAKGELKWPMHLFVFDEGLVRVLVGMVMDPFDDVRCAAASILKMSCNIDFEVGPGNWLLVIETGLQRAEPMMLASGRADHADGVAHLYSLISTKREGSQQDAERDSISIVLHKLECNLAIAKDNLVGAVLDHPLHGLLTSLRYILNNRDIETETNGGMFDRLTSLFQSVWDVVKLPLCNDAPEGYMPGETRESADVSTKDTLSYCWRALKEASLLMGVLLPVLGKFDIKGRCSSRTLELIADLTFRQLAELRHRGAFSTVAQTWILCCAHCGALSDDTGRLLLQAWYRRTLALLQDHVTINTRRSAGLPSLICGILIASPDGKMLDQAMHELQSIARAPVKPQLMNEGSLPQVHAMNCVKDIIKSTKLADRSESYLYGTLQLAADSLRSEAWAIRNCGLMLLRAIIDRLLGTNDSVNNDEVIAQKPLSLERFPHLLDTLLGLIEGPFADPDNAHRRSEAVFPALQLLQATKLPDSTVLDVQVAVLGLMDSPSWHIREKAAQTYASFVSRSEVADEVAFILSFASTANQNRLHGLLRTAFHLVASGAMGFKQDSVGGRLCSSEDLKLDQCWSTVNAHVDLFTNNKCAVTRAAYVDLYNTARKLRTDTLPSSDYQNEILGRVTGNYSHGVPLHVIDELRRSLEAMGPAIPALRLSLATALASEMVFPKSKGDLKQPIDTVTELAFVDSNACCALLDRITAIQTNSTAEIVMIAQHVLRRQIDPSVRLAAMRALVASLDNDRNTLRLTASPNVDIMSLAPSLSERTILQNPEGGDLWLELQALIFNSAALTHTETVPIYKVRHWLDACRQNLHDQEVSSREAAARSINRLSSKALTKVLNNSGSSSVLLGLVLFIYDLLNDDDEDIRLLAAQLAGRLTFAAGCSDSEIVMTPFLATQSMLTLLVTKLSTDRALAETAAYRAFGQMHRVSDGFKACAKANDVLFAEEKQNLYIDDAREVKVWTQVLMKVHPSTISTKFVKRLSLWFMDGMTAMEQGLGEADGSLGVRMEDRVFTLGLQVLYSAEALLNWSIAGIRVGVRPADVLARLQRWTIFERQDELHPLWRWEARRVLFGAVNARFSVVAKIVQSNEDNLTKVSSLDRG